MKYYKQKKIIELFQEIVEKCRRVHSGTFACINVCTIHWNTKPTRYTNYTGWELSRQFKMTELDSISVYCFLSLFFIFASFVQKNKYQYVSAPLFIFTSNRTRELCLSIRIKCDYMLERRYLYFFLTLIDLTNVVIP